MAKKKTQVNFQVLGFDDFYRLYETTEGKKFFDEYFRHYGEEPKEGLKRIHWGLEGGNRLLTAFAEVRGREKPVGLTVFSETPKSLNTVRTFVTKKQRRQGIARKLSYHLTGLARSKNKFVYRGLQSGEMLTLAKKMREKPRALYRKGKPAGKAEIIQTGGGRLGHTLIFPENIRKKAPKTPLHKLAEKLKKAVKRPR